METAALNVLPEPKTTPVYLIFFRQFKSFLTGILFIAAIISFVAADVLDGVLILLVILVNALIGFFQEYKAKKDVEALSKMVVLTARVIREGKEMEIEAKFITLGDTVILEAGDKVPADGDLLEAVNLTVEEAVLTGESVPVVKEMKDGVFMGTVVLSGRGKFKVSAIGVSTKFGQIAKNLESVSEEKTPLEIKIEDLSKKIGIGAVLVIALITLVGIFQGRNFFEMFFSGVALAVAAVPEGLPAVLTIALAVGVQRLSKRRAIVKRLASTESLGSVDVIVTDKTGTLTKNEMVVSRVVNERGEVGPVGEVKDIGELVRVGVLCNSSAIVLEEGGKIKILGDTTEGALLVLAQKSGVEIDTLRAGNPIRKEVPFDAQTRVMSVVVGEETLTKGAPEKIIEEAKNLTASQKEKFFDMTRKLASEGLRMVAMAADGKFLGMVGISDPPREEVWKSINDCQRAGIHVVMATGDYPETARAIALQLGLLEKGEEVVTGGQLAEYSDLVLRQNLMKIGVFARVTPEDKLRIVEAFQHLGKIVAVTGDGVNDAPALKRAQVGVAMGITGSDVAKEAADLIITDDNFSTIVAAIEEGRVIFANLVKAIKFLLSSNLGEVLTVTGAVLLGLPLPLSPLALLWINVVSDGMPAISLAVDPREKDVLSSKKRNAGTLLGKKELIFMTGIGIFVALGTLASFWAALPSGEDVARLTAFSVMVVLDLVVAFVVRGRRQKFFANKLLLLSVLVTIVIQGIILAVPAFREIFV